MAANVTVVTVFVYLHPSLVAEVMDAAAMATEIWSHLCSSSGRLLGLDWIVSAKS